MLNGWRVERERVVVEILTIIMLTPTGWIGLGYGFGVEQLNKPTQLYSAKTNLTQINPTQPNQSQPKSTQQTQPQQTQPNSTQLNPSYLHDIASNSAHWI